MSDRGFTVAELLVALGVSAVLWTAVSSALPAWQAAFETTPAAIDRDERSMVGIATLAAALRAAGGADVGATSRVPLSSVLPVVRPLQGTGVAAGDPFSGLAVVSAVPGGGRGRLDRDQPGAAAPLTLAAGDRCPHVDVCGFRGGVTAAIVDRFGRYDVFIVAAVDASTSRLVPSAPLSAPYRAGAAVVEVVASEYRLVRQADGSTALTQSTAAGAVEPVVDGVTSLGLSGWVDGRPAVVRLDGDVGWASYGPLPPPADWLDASGAWASGESCVVSRVDSTLRSRFAPLGGDDPLVEVSAPTFADGPWCPSADGSSSYDADFLRLRRVDIMVRVEVLSAMLRGPAGVLFARAGTGTHAPLHWVPDRTITLSVALRNEP